MHRSPHPSRGCRSHFLIGERMKEQKDLRPASDGKRRRLNPKKLWLLLVILGATAVFFVFYELMMHTSFFPFVMGGYMAVLVLLLAVYIIYNRGFTRRRLTPEMLPDDWSEELKAEVIADGERRMKRSLWMAVLIAALGLTLLIDAFRLFVPDLLKNLFYKQ